jgi:leucine dehydrogenase
MKESSSKLEVSLDHEEVLVRPGVRTGLPIIVGIHSTRLGPAVGGLRITRYSSATDAVVDCLRLSRGMTLKAAAVDNGTGGGKSVVPLLPGGPQELTGGIREALLLDVADVVHSLNGRYHVAPDVGTGPTDMRRIRRRTPYVGGWDFASAGLPLTTLGTAAGVELAMLAAAAEAWGSEDIAGKRVTVVGYGGVGRRLAELLQNRGAEVTVSDIDATLRETAVGNGHKWTDLDGAYTLETDILAPCALGGFLTHELTSRIRAKVVVGSANNQLAEDTVAEALRAAGILWVPDFIANAGGLMYANGIEMHGLSKEESQDRLSRIAEAATRSLRRSRDEGITPLQAAYEQAHIRLDEASNKH